MHSGIWNIPLPPVATWTRSHEPGRAAHPARPRPGAELYEIGDEIWQQSLAEAIAAEAQTIAEDAGAGLLEDSSEASHNRLRDQVITDMTRALARAGDTCRAPDGVRYSLRPRRLPTCLWLATEAARCERVARRSGCLR